MLLISTGGVCERLDAAAEWWSQGAYVPTNYENLRVVFMVVVTYQERIIERKKEKKFPLLLFHAIKGSLIVEWWSKLFDTWPLKNKKRGLVGSWWKENVLVVAFLNKPLEVGGWGGGGITQLLCLQTQKIIECKLYLVKVS